MVQYGQEVWYGQMTEKELYENRLPSFGPEEAKGNQDTGLFAVNVEAGMVKKSEELG